VYFYEDLWSNFPVCSSDDVDDISTTKHDCRNNKECLDGRNHLCDAKPDDLYTRALYHFPVIDLLSCRVGIVHRV